MLLYRIARGKPELAKQKIVQMAQRQLGPGVDIAHFTPDYKPWDQRVCVVPGRRPVPPSARPGRSRHRPHRALHRKRHPAAVRARAGGRRRRDGHRPVAVGAGRRGDRGRRQAFRPGAAMAYKGMMLSDMPNSVMTFGYTNASWTLKADLTAAWVCRLLNYMDRKGQAIAVVRREAGVEPEPFLSFTSGYVQRAGRAAAETGQRAVHGRCTRTISRTCSRSASAASPTA
jgi:monooxygenase